MREDVKQKHFSTPLRETSILCLQTSHATWLKMAGADVKDAQAQMRHSRSSTKLDIYQHFVPESQQGQSTD
jgi:integrase